MMKTHFISTLIVGLSLLQRSLQAPQNVPQSVEAGSSSKDEGLDKEKGVVDAIKCKAGENVSSSGCEKAMTVQHQSSIIKPSDNNGDDEQEQTKKKKKHQRPSSDTRVTGKDRPWKYVFLPGRKLDKGKRCRPNEVQGKNQRCIRRRRPTTMKPTRI
ncbi:hypothetical protein KR059_003173 [Drosophila kikkawai]|nr:hypothetical protein KR059_003173 [Drosophila kikkawai]